MEAMHPRVRFLEELENSSEQIQGVATGVARVGSMVASSFPGC